MATTTRVYLSNGLDAIVPAGYAAAIIGIDSLNRMVGEADGVRYFLTDCCGTTTKRITSSAAAVICSGCGRVAPAELAETPGAMTARVVGVKVTRKTYTYRGWKVTRVPTDKAPLLDITAPDDPNTVVVTLDGGSGRKSENDAADIIDAIIAGDIAAADAVRRSNHYAPILTLDVIEEMRAARTR